MKIRNYILLVLFFISMESFGQVSGTIFQDIPVTGVALNTYGVKEGNEQGIKGVTITVFPGGATTTSAADGTWSIAGSGALRVEFSNWPSFLRESPDAGVSNSSVRFVTAPMSDINLGLHDPNDFSENPIPPYFTNIISGGTGVGSTIACLVTNQYQDQGLSSDHNDYDGNPGTGPTSTVDVLNGDVGTVWGKGYQKTNRRTFIASILWRHAGFASGNPSRIYVVNNTNSPGSLLGSFDLQGVTPTNGGAAIDLGSVDRTSGPDYNLSADPDDRTVDIDAYAKVAKMSYGDLDVDNNTNTAWVTNLFQKSIISIDISGDMASFPGTVNQYMIESLPGIPSCPNGEIRPWGLGIHDGKGYLGCICDASGSGNFHDLKAYVLSFDLNDPTTGFTTEISINMDYDRSNDDGYSEDPNFYAWSDVPHDVASTNWDGYNQPVLSDIDFDAKGNMFLSFLDRYGLQIGMKNSPAVSGASSNKERAYAQGEVFKVCNNNIWELEGTGGCPAGAMPDGGFFDDRGGDNNANHAGGSTVVLKGSNQVIMAVNDPHPTGLHGSDYWTTNGVETFSTIDGSIDNWYSHVDSGSPKYTGKSTGIGDIELLTDAAPTEIGNLVWEDTNGNGIQDPGEPKLAGVIVELVQGTTVIASATTDAGGHFIFSNNPTATTTTSHIYNISNLVSGENFIIRIPNVNGGAKQGVFGTNEPTVANSGESANADINDSDGIVVGTNAEINISSAMIPVSGANNHSFDFGFTAPAVTSLSIDSATPSNCNSGTNTYSLEVKVTYENTPAGDMTITTENGASFTFTPVGTTGTETITLTGLVADGQATIDVTATYVNDGTVTNTRIDAYDAPANCTPCPPSVCMPITATKH